MGWEKGTGRPVEDFDDIHALAHGRMGKALRWDIFRSRQMGNK
jgi:hypothetical protein